MQQTKPVPVDPEPVFPVKALAGGRITTATLDELWQTAPRASKRI
jgi:hypothetical protein